MESLLLSRDDEVIRVLRLVLQDMGIEVEVCTGAERAQQELARRKYDAVIIDCDDVHGATDILSSLRKTPSNKTSTAFAIINGITSVRAAFEMGANLALEKPISLERAKHSFRAAHGLMLQERRRYYRHAVDMAVTVCLEGRPDIFATANNLSEGGMAVHVKQSLPASKGMAKLKFVLPGTHDWIEVYGTVAWADEQGEAGLRFENLPYTVKERLGRWFAEKADPKKPAPHQAQRPGRR
jgi:CheY-like chemotaxis protein